MVCTVAIALMVTAAGAPMEAAPFDGKRRLVFSCSGCPQKPSGPSLYVVNASGTGFRRIETPRLSPYGPRWSPNGRRIAVSSRFTDIWTIDFAGRAARRLTHACIECDYPPAAWSPRPIVIPELPPSAYSELYGLDWS
jgi:Tol biopolymer transport system component